MNQNIISSEPVLRKSGFKAEGYWNLLKSFKLGSLMVKLL